MAEATEKKAKTIPTQFVKRIGLVELSGEF